jgi:hypothetical protein
MCGIESSGVIEKSRRGAMPLTIDDSQELKISTEAAITHGIVNGAYYGSVWGFSSYWIQDYPNYKTHLQRSNPHRLAEFGRCICKCGRSSFPLP